MKKYLLVNQYTLPPKREAAVTKTVVLEAESPEQALSIDAFNIFANSDTDRWCEAVKTGYLEQSTIGIYELTTGKNLIADVVEAEK